MMKYMTALGFLLSSLCASQGTAAGKQDISPPRQASRTAQKSSHALPGSIEAIRREYRFIRASLPSMTQEKISLEDQSSEGGERILYRDSEGSVRLIRDEVMGETGKWVREIYCSAGKAFFVYEATVHYNAPIYAESFDDSKSSRDEERFYLPGGKLDRWLRNSAAVDPAGGKFAAKAEEMQKELDLRKLIRKSRP